MEDPSFAIVFGPPNSPKSRNILIIHKSLEIF